MEAIKQSYEAAEAYRRCSTHAQSSTRLAYSGNTSWLGRIAARADADSDVRPIGSWTGTVLGCTLSDGERTGMHRRLRQREDGRGRD